MKTRKVSRLAKRIFRPLVGSTEPMPLNLKGVAPMDAYDAIREVGDLIRCTDAPSPLEALYIITAGNESVFVTWWDRFKARWMARWLSHFGDVT